MLYLARNLHLVNGTVLRNIVVDVCDGVVNDFYPFSFERESMFLVDDIYLSNFENDADKQIASCLCESKMLYACTLSEDGELHRLK